MKPSVPAEPLSDDTRIYARLDLTRFEVQMLEWFRQLSGGERERELGRLQRYRDREIAAGTPRPPSDGQYSAYDLTINELSFLSCARWISPEKKLDLLGRMFQNADGGRGQTQGIQS